MTNGSGPTLPPGPRPHILSGAADQSARIVRLPDALSAVARAQRLEGEVVQQNPDGSTRVRTDKGDIDIIIRGRQPQSGQSLEVDVPSGRPPRQVVIRQAPQNSSNQQQQDIENAPVQTRLAAQTARAEQAVQRAINEQQTTATRGTQNTQASPEAQRPLPATPRPPVQGQPLPSQPPAETAVRPAPLPLGSTVRLLPVTPAQAQQIVLQTAQNLISLPTTITKAVFTANLATQTVQTDNIKTLLQVRGPDINALSQNLRTLPLPTTQSAAPVGNAIANPPAVLQTAQQFLTFPLPPSQQQSQTPQATTLYAKTGPALTLTQHALPSPVATPLAGNLITALPGLENLPALSSSFARITQFDGKLLNIQPPQITLTVPTEGKAQGLPVPAAAKIMPASALPQAQAGTLNAQVTGVTSQNLPLITLQWPGSTLPQSFVLQFSASNLPLGSEITLQPQNVIIAKPGSIPAPQTGNAQSAGTATITLPTGLGSLFGPAPWPALDDAYQTLLQAGPQAAQTLARVLPSPANPAQLGSAALLFIAAVRSGDISSWLGDKKIDILQRVGGKNNVLSRLTQDLSTLAQRTADNAGSTSEWRAVPLPLFWEGEVQKIALYVKDDGKQKSEDEKVDGQTRFIFDLDLNRMGGVQLDGLVRGDRFDLVVRTQSPLSVSMQQAMKHSYSHALHNTDLHGDLSFQGDIKNWVNVLQQDVQYGASA